MSLIALVGGCVLGALLMRLYLTAVLRGGETTRAEFERVLSELRARETDLTTVAADRERLGKEVDRLREHASALDRSLGVTQAKLDAKDDQETLITKAREALESGVTKTVSKAMSDSSVQLTELAKAKLGEETKSLSALVAPVAGKLNEVDMKLAAFERERAASQKALSTQIDGLRHAQTELHTGTQALVTALRRPQVRGRWGETQLRNLVEMLGMVEHLDFDLQTSTKTDDGTLRPDAIIKMARGKRVVVDAKTPLDAYLDAIQAPEGDERDAHLVRHAKQLRTHLMALDSKNYWTQFADTPDFVIAFIPNDALVNAALDADPSLIELLYSKRVLIASPTTLTGLLHVVDQGWRHERMAENARELEQLGQELHSRLGKLGTLLNKLGNQITTVVKGFNTVAGSYQSRVLPSARRISELGAASGNDELVSIEPITEIARELPAGADLSERADADLDLPAGAEIRALDTRPASNREPLDGGIPDAGDHGDAAEEAA